MKVLALLLSLSCAVAAQEANLRFRKHYHVWKAPLYVLLLPRDLIDVPVKGLTSIPGFNLVMIAPLGVLNMISGSLVWTCTDYGMRGNFEAWRDCTQMPNRLCKEGKFPLYINHRDYFPNLRSIQFVTEEVEEGPPSK